MSETTAVPSAQQPGATASNAPRPVAKNLMGGALLVLLGFLVLVGAVYVGLDHDVQAASGGAPLVCSDSTGECTEATDAGPWLAVAGVGVVIWGAALLLTAVLELGRRSDRAVGAVERPSAGGPAAADEPVLPDGEPSALE